jgi:hypothetical protein
MLYAKSLVHYIQISIDSSKQDPRVETGRWAGPKNQDICEIFERVVAWSHSTMQTWNFQFYLQQSPPLGKERRFKPIIWGFLNEVVEASVGEQLGHIKFCQYLEHQLYCVSHKITTRCLMFRMGWWKLIPVFSCFPAIV